MTFSVDLPDEPGARQSNLAVLAACDEALRPRRCSLSTKEEPARVRVRWTTPLRVQIDEWDGRRWRRQTLLFTEEDRPSERARAVGLLLAALGSGAGARARDEAEPRPQLESQSTVGLDLSAAFMSGPGAAPGHWRSGLQTTLGARVPSWPIGMRAHGSWAIADTLDSAVDAVWWSASAGPYGVYEPLGWLRLSAGLDLGAEWLLVTLRDGGSGNQRQSRVYLTLRPWATATVWVNRWLGIRVGAEFYTTPGQALRVDGEFVGQNRTFGVLGLSGVDLRLLQ